MFAFKFASLLASIAFVNAANIAPFISNGNEAEITEFPFLVSIQHIDVHVCSGSLLSEKWILSAARCFERPIGELFIEYGRTVIAPESAGPHRSAFSRIIQHEDFTLNPTSNNIAVAEAKSALVTGYNEPFVKLPVSGARFLSGTSSVHAGWGHTGPNVRNNLLLKAEVKIVSHAECLKALGTNAQLDRENICTMGDSVICNGDIGE
jgi:secreted trypsin-like serine protease